jgi:hypothetical protein
LQISETFEFELKDFTGLEIIQGSINYLEERLKKAQEDILHIGSINMRALEVYDTIKAEYDQVQEKVNILSTEKEGEEYIEKLGPGLITGAADDDPSGIATYSQTGAQYGTTLLWLAASIPDIGRLGDQVRLSS